MELIEFIKHSNNSVFLVSIVIILIMSVVELISVTLGFSISETIDNLLPDVEVEADIDADVNVPVLDWLNFGKIPLLIFIILFLASFGLSGFAIQGIINRIIGSLLPTFIAVPLALFSAVILVHFLGNVIAKIIPKVETTAVKVDSLSGKIAEISIGTATKDNPAEAKVKDRHNKTHYVRLVPGDPEESFQQGDKVVLTDLVDGIFTAEKVDLDL